MKKPSTKESDLYPLVEKWLAKQHQCFHTSIDRGLRYSRVDVLGIRDIGGELSGSVETIAVEVKKGGSPFATISGQTLGYRVYANKVYLAEARSAPFESTELDIASNLGIGLVWIRGRRCIEVLSSPTYTPIARLQLQLFAQLKLGQCSLCDTLFNTGNKSSASHWSNVSRRLDYAIKHDKAFVFWNYSLGERKRAQKIGRSKEGKVFDRRFICPDCVYGVISHIRPPGPIGAS